MLLVLAVMFFWTLVFDTSVPNSSRLFGEGRSRALRGSGLMVATLASFAWAMLMGVCLLALTWIRRAVIAISGGGTAARPGSE